MTHFEIAANDPEPLKRLYGSLFGWWLKATGTAARNSCAVNPDGNGIEGTIIHSGNGSSRRLRFFVEVEDVLENLSHAEELGGRIVRLPHEIISAGGRLTVASFADPDGNIVSSR